MPFSVILTEKGGATQRLDFESEEITIGRVDENDICLPKGNISKKHTKIVVKDGKIIVLDLKSTNGTYVNGKKLAGPQVITPADKVYVGDFILSVEPPDMAGDEGLSKASILGWRYLAQSDQARNYSFVVHQDASDASHRFAEMNRGLFVEGTLNIISDSELRAKLDQGTYDLSVLMIHALGLFALWLRAKNSSPDLITIVPPGPTYLEAWPKLYSLEDFQNAVKPEAIRKLAVARTSFV